MKKKKRKNNKKKKPQLSRTEKIARQFAELEKRAQSEPNFDYSSEMEKLISANNLTIGDMLDIDYIIQNENLLTK